MADATINAVVRTEFGKGAARRARRAGLVPAVVYGHGTDPVHLSLPVHETALALRQANALLEVNVAGTKQPLLVLPKQVQRDPVRGTVDHVDLIIVRKGEKVEVEIPLVFIGEERTDCLIVADQQTIVLRVEATRIPATIEVDVTGLPIGTVICARDLKLPAGAVFPGEPDDLILSIAPLPLPEQPVEAEGAE